MVCPLPAATGTATGAATGAGSASAMNPPSLLSALGLATGKTQRREERLVFEALEVSLKMVESLRGLMSPIQRQDPDLCRQIRRAAASVSLNLGEGRKRIGADRKHLWRIAAGSAEEVRVALRLAQAWGILGPEELERPLEDLDRVLAMLWRLTR